MNWGTLRRGPMNVRFYYYLQLQTGPPVHRTMQDGDALMMPRFRPPPVTSSFGGREAGVGGTSDAESCR